MATLTPILLYHSIAEEASPRFRKWNVRPAVFRAHMAYLHDQRHTTLTVTQLAQAMADRSIRLPDRPVVLTFDDGFADFLNALPTLKEHGFLATLYITTGAVGGTSRWLDREGEGDRPMLTWEQIAALDASGIECGAHSRSHLQLDTLSTAAAWSEIADSKLELEQYLGHPVLTFAYPHGYHGPVVRRQVQEAGYSSACAVKHAMATTDDDIFALSRIIVTGDTDLARFAELIAGRDLPIAPARERLRTKVWRFSRRALTLATNVSKGNEDVIRQRRRL